MMETTPPRTWEDLEPIAVLGRMDTLCQINVLPQGTTVFIFLVEKFSVCLSIYPEMLVFFFFLSFFFHTFFPFCLPILVTFILLFSF